MNNSILVVDDDLKILNLLGKYLIKKGYDVKTAASVKEARSIMENTKFDLLVLDVMIPFERGSDFAKSIKGSGLKIPIILLTALSDVKDKIYGFENGADDYITKPFEPEELVLRIKNLINLYQSSNSGNNHNIVWLGECKYDFTTKSFIRSGATVILSSSEHKLLEILIDNRGNFITRARLAEILKISDRSVDVQITRLREKIGDTNDSKILHTVRHKGYALYV